MSTITQIRQLAGARKVQISAHGYDELAADGLTVDEVVAGVMAAVVVEDYPDFYNGPAVLVLQVDSTGRAIHMVWGIAKGTSEPAVLITAYRPNPVKWSSDFMRRQP